MVRRLNNRLAGGGFKIHCRSGTFPTVSPFRITICKHGPLHCNNSNSFLIYKVFLDSNSLLKKAKKVLTNINSNIMIITDRNYHIDYNKV